MKVYLPLIDNGLGFAKCSFVFSLALTLQQLRDVDIQIDRISDSHANRAMNKASGSFLASDCTEMVVIDTDIVFAPAHLERLLSHDVLFVGGIYPKRDDTDPNNVPPCIATFPDGARPWPANPELFQVRRVGRGFVRIKREVFERMKAENGGPALHYDNHLRDEWDFWPSGSVTGDYSSYADDKREWLSEDWSFCERANALGIPILVDSGIVLAHEGDKVYKFGPCQFGPKEGA